MNKVRVDSNQDSLKYPMLILVFLISSGLLGCGNPGFSTNAGITGGSSATPTPALPPSPTALKSTGIEVVTGAAVNVVGQNGSKASLSIGDVGKNKMKSANGYQVFLSISGQNSSAQ